MVINIVYGHKIQNLGPEYFNMLQYKINVQYSCST